nr:FapA family protein [uncultured Butyricicoccus sp.]
MAGWKGLFSRKQNDVPENQSDSNKNATAFEVVMAPTCKISSLYELSHTRQSQKSFRIPVIASSQKEIVLSNEQIKIEQAKLKNSLEMAAKKRWMKAFSHGMDRPVDSLDEDVFVHIADNKMMAWVLLFPALGTGKQLTGSYILRELINQGVTFGIDYNFLYSLHTQEKFDFCLFPVAYGKLPVSGQNGRIVELYPRDVDLKNEHCELSHVDYAWLNLRRKVQKGGVICEIIPPMPGISGIAVTRELILPELLEGQAVEVPQGRNTCLSEDGRYLVAEKEGNVGYSGKNFQVKPILEIFNGIGPKDEHNINFLGDVHIHGDVCPNVVIRATGDVQIDGVIEACTIEAGENVVVSDGIQGQHGATVRAHKSVYARYLENCDVYAQGVVQADCIIDCNIYSNGTVTARTGKGIILRGTIRSSQGVFAKVIGSRADQETHIVLGGLPCDEEEQDKIAEELQKATDEINRISAMPKTRENDSILSKMRLNQCVAKMKLERFQKDLEAYNASIRGNDPRKLISNHIYPGTEVTILDKVFTVQYLQANCTIGIRDDGRLGYISSEEAIS